MKKIKKKHGIIAGIIAVITAIAHVTHFPIILLAFFGFVSASFIDLIWFKIITIITVLSISTFIYLYKKQCEKKCCDVSKLNSDESANK